ncbi:MAG: hypothetical protein ACR2OV_01490 [Hyphomicrobiaceae bacterium]
MTQAGDIAILLAMHVRSWDLAAKSASAAMGPMAASDVYCVSVMAWLRVRDPASLPEVKL